MTGNLLKWQKFLHQNKGRGLTIDELAKEWHKSKGICKDQNVTDCKAKPKCVSVDGQSGRYCREKPHMKKRTKRTIRTTHTSHICSPCPPCPSHITCPSTLSSLTDDRDRIITSLRRELEECKKTCKNHASDSFMVDNSGMTSYQQSLLRNMRTRFTKE